MNKDDEKSYILKTAKMRLEKVEQRLKMLRNKQAMKKCDLQANDVIDKSTVINRKISIVETAVDDIRCDGDGPHLLERKAGKIQNNHPKEVISHSEDASMSAIHKARHVLKKLATHDKSLNMYSVSESLPHSVVSNENHSSGIERFGLKKESVEKSTLNLHGNLHFSEILHFPKAEATDADRWRTKKLNHDLEKLFSLSTLQHSHEEVDESDENGKKNVFSSIEDICWHLDCLSVETQWDSQFVDSMQVKQCHMEAVKDWRRQRPLDKLMSGSLRDLPVDISSLLLPCVVDDIIVCEVLSELQRSLSCQIGEGSELTKDLVDDMFQQLSYDLDLLTASICSYEVPPNGNWQHEAEALGDSAIPAEPGKCSSSASTLLFNLEQQLGTIMNATSLGQSMADSALKDLGSLSRTCKGHQKVDQESNILPDSDLKSLYSPWDVMVPIKADPVEKLHSLSSIKEVRNLSKRSLEDEIDRRYDSRQKMSESVTDNLETSSCNEDFNKESNFMNEMCREIDSHSRNRKKLKSSRQVEGIRVDNIRMQIDAVTAQNSDFQGLTDQENCNLFNAHGNENLPGDADFEQCQQPDIQQKSRKSPTDERLENVANPLPDSVSEMDNTLLLTVSAAVTQYKRGAESLITPEFGPARVVLSEDLQSGSNLSASSLNSLKTLSQTPLRILRSSSRDNHDSRRQFESFDELCKIAIVGGNLIVKSAYNTERARHRESGERRNREYVGPRNREYGGPRNREWRGPRNREFAGARNREYGERRNQEYGKYRRRSSHDRSRARDDDVGKRQHRTPTLKRSEDRIARGTNRLSSPEDVGDTTQIEHESIQPSSPPMRQAEILSDVADVSSVLSDSKAISVEKVSKGTIQSCPRFMQTFRHSQIAKRKNQTSVLSSSILWPSEFPFPGSNVTESSVQNGSLVQTDDAATSSPDEVSSAMCDQLYSIPLPTLPAAFSTTTSTPVEEKVEKEQERQSSLTALSSKTIDMFSCGDWQPITVSCATSSKLTVSKDSPLVEQTTALSASAGVEVSTLANLPSSAARPSCDSVGMSEDGSFNVNSNVCPIRVFVYNQEKKECQLAKAALTSRGAMTFDPYNVVLLRAIVPLECLVLVHSSDLARLCQVSNLMRLKRDLRISFYAFDTVDQVLNRNLKPVYPRGGFVVIDTGTLIHCNSDHLEKLCQFMQKQANEKGIAWQLMISPEVANILNTHKCEVQRTDQQLAKLADVIARYCSSGIIDIISTELFKRSKMSAFDYQQCCLALQVQNMHKYRHFLFITDAVKQHVNVRGFTENGVDVMNIPEFLRGFVGCSVTAVSKLCKEYSSAISTETLAKYIDSIPSSASETLMNKWSVPFSVPNVQ